MGLFSRRKKPDIPDLAAMQQELAAQDAQLARIKAAEGSFERSRDLQALLDFWERLWQSGGLLFRGSRWTFRLTDLYFQQRRYDDALRALSYISVPEYADRKAAYIAKIHSIRRKNNDVS